MKVIRISNFGKENVDDKLIVDNLGEQEAQDLAKKLNSSESEDSFYAYRAVSDSYSLYVYDPNK